MKEILPLTGLRFLAAFLVFLLHATTRSHFKSIPWFFQNIFAQGAIGVTLFFALSGFLLTYSHLKEFEQPDFKGLKYYRRFMTKRLVRLYPVYLAAVGVFLVLCALMKQEFNPIATTMTIFTLQAWYTPMAMQVLGAGWSISVEMFFYLCFPLLLPSLLRIQKTQVLFVLLTCSVLAATIPGCLYHLGYIERYFTYTFPPLRIAEFISGIITSILVFNRGWRVSPLTAVAALSITTLYLVRFSIYLKGDTTHDLLVLPTCLLLLASMSIYPTSPFFSWLCHGAMTYLGKISYGFYLWQAVTFAYLDNKYGWDGLFTLPLWYQPALFLVTTVIAILSYRFIEVPAHQYLSSKFFLKQKATIGLQSAR